jgi:hypothetical protein
MNSNLVPDKEETFEKLLKASYSVPHFEIYTSNESIGIQSEYIRYGMKYNIWRKNLVRLIRESNIKKLHMMMTINALCLESITEFMDDMLLLREQFGVKAPTMTLNILRFPSFQSCAIIPATLKNTFKTKLENWLSTKLDVLTDGEQAHVQRLIDYLDVVKTPHRDTAEIPKLYNDFRAFYEQYDVRRNRNFRSCFPSFVDWYDSIPYNLNQESIQAQNDPATTDTFINDDV